MVYLTNSSCRLCPWLFTVGTKSNNRMVLLLWFVHYYSERHILLWRWVMPERNACTNFSDNLCHPWDIYQLFYSFVSCFCYQWIFWLFPMFWLWQSQLWRWTTHYLPLAAGDKNRDLWQTPTLLLDISLIAIINMELAG